MILNISQRWKTYWKKDTDTVATIAMSAASRRHEYSKKLPDKLWYELENSNYERDYLIDLDNKLLGAYKK